MEDLPREELLSIGLDSLAALELVETDDEVGAGPLLLVYPADEVEES